MADDDRLAHSVLDGNRVFPGIATDYANMIRAALAIFALDGDASFLTRAEVWFAAARRHHFVESAAAYNLAADDAPALIATPLSLTDEATPAATGTMATNAATLFMLTGNAAYREHAERILARLASNNAARDVVGTASLQSGFDSLLRGRLALIMGEGAEAGTLLDVALAEADPALFVMKTDPKFLRPGHPAAGKVPTKGAAALFLCDAFRCLPELVSEDEAHAALTETRRGLARS